ncbi:L-asparagine permease [Sinomonas cellulolyticus]|uniref:Amino acid permease n=1 Tax=Sinomonas cellulolyticus TaxID=2801916 RepID=A0ABS1K423_9MICC|nr:MULTISPECIES: amino acid permease [Sinomonas]MBL0706446.1 amino acid permease [Sinomonas cellulolyticus]GHG44664.1 L-asparagine permease [Sinomonas sp. KCTC 49339]
MSSSDPQPPGIAEVPDHLEDHGHAHVADHVIHAEDAGYHKGLKARQIQMIAIGGAIGTGLFLGAGGRLAAAGPSLVFAYAICGAFVFLILRALGELVLHRPSSGSFVSYAREFFGEKAAYVSGWFYWINWAMTTIVDTTAAALYMHFFGRYVPWISAVPQWTWALIALLVVLTLNLVSVKVFGEMEFWFALIKVAALVVFLLVGIYFVVVGTPTGAATGFSLISDHGGIFPMGIAPMILLMQGVVFAYASVELVGTAAGETQNPEKIMPKAINSVVVRIAVFYVGSVVLLSLLLPYTAYQKGVSPFVTFFGSIGVQGMDVIMNLVVLTAALSSLNAGLYSTGRILRSMAAAGSAPKFALRMNKAGVPYGGIAITAVVSLLGVPLNYLVPSDAFEIVLNVASVGILSTWATIVLCQIQLQRWAKRGWTQRPAFRMPGAPYTGYVTLVFLAVVFVLVLVDSPWTLAATAAACVLMVIGWYAVRERIHAIAAERDGFTGAAPVIANRPAGRR